MSQAVEGTIKFPYAWLRDEWVIIQLSPEGEVNSAGNIPRRKRRGIYLAL